MIESILAGVLVAFTVVVLGGGLVSDIRDRRAGQSLRQRDRINRLEHELLPGPYTHDDCWPCRRGALPAPPAPTARPSTEKR